MSIRLDIFINSSIYYEVITISMYTNPSVSIQEIRRISEKFGLLCIYIEVSNINNKTDINDYDKILHVVEVTL